MLIASYVRFLLLLLWIRKTTPTANSQSYPSKSARKCFRRLSRDAQLTTQQSLSNTLNRTSRSFPSAGLTLFDSEPFSKKIYSSYRLIRTSKSMSMEVRISRRKPCFCFTMGSSYQKVPLLVIKASQSNRSLRSIIKIRMAMGGSWSSIITSRPSDCYSYHVNIHNCCFFY